MKNIVKLSLFLLIFLVFFAFSFTVKAVLPPLQVSCYANPNPAKTDQSVNFTATVNNGSGGNYTYSWTGSCTGSYSDCVKSFYQPGFYPVAVYVTSGSQTGSATCSVTVNQNCRTHEGTRCNGNSAYWYNSCGNQEELIQNCSYNQTCQNGQCTYNCTPHNSIKCFGNSRYWADSCGGQQELIENCGLNQICQNNQCVSNCALYSARRCYQGSIYWYDSCGNRQLLIQTCALNQVCSSGQCVNKTTPSNYVKHSTKSCHNNDIYWYDSNSALQDLFQSCSDNNLCTADACSNSQCSNEKKCDGSTCPINSSDYNQYCGQSVQPTQGQLVVSAFGKKETEPLQWEKNINATTNDKIHFLLIVKNNSSQPVSDVVVKSGVPGEVGSIANLKIDDISVAGDIVSGLNIGSIPPATSRAVTFEGVVVSSAVSGAKQIVGNATSGTSSDSDSFVINIAAVQGAGAAAVSGFSFKGFLGRWYLWILIALVLIFLFILIFRRLSSD